MTASAPGPMLLAVGVIAAGTSAGGAWAPFSDAIAHKVPTAETRRALSLVNAGSPVGLVVASVLVLVASPAVFGTVDRAADSDNLVGALVVTVAIIALAEVGRAARFLNVAFGAWIIAALWLLGGGTTVARWNDVAAGAVLILLSLRRGPVGERYGRWQRFIR